MLIEGFDLVPGFRRSDLPVCGLETVCVIEEEKKLAFLHDIYATIGADDPKSIGAESDTNRTISNQFKCW